MGLLLSKYFDSLFSQQEIKLLLLGIEGVGKSTILNKLKQGELVSSIQTFSLQMETILYKKILFNIWEAGQRHYYQHNQGIIFVIDSSDKERIHEAKEELHSILQQREIRNSPLLILANKQDIAAMSITEITENLELHSLKERDWFIQGACAITAEGLYEGLDWLKKSISKQI